MLAKKTKNKKINNQKKEIMEKLAPIEHFKGLRDRQFLIIKTHDALLRKKFSERYYLIITNFFVKSSTKNGVFVFGKNLLINESSSNEEILRGITMTLANNFSSIISYQEETQVPYYSIKWSDGMPSLRTREFYSINEGIVTEALRRNLASYDNAITRCKKELETAVDELEKHTRKRNLIRLETKRKKFLAEMRYMGIILPVVRRVPVEGVLVH
jgi:hypothetical protein